MKKSLPVIYAGIDDVFETCVEGTTLFNLLSRVRIEFDNDPILNPDNVSKDGNLHAGTKIKGYLLKQCDVKFINAWEEISTNFKEETLEFISPGTFRMCKRNNQLNLYYGDWVKQFVRWCQVNNIDIISTYTLQNAYTGNWLNKVQDNMASQYNSSLALF